MRIFSEASLAIAKDQYLVDGEDFNQAVWRACKAYGSNDGHSKRLYDYIQNQWFFFASPVIANAPDENGLARGLPISCFLNYVEDSRKGILDHYSENGWLTSNGGGIGTYWGSLRSVGEKTSRGSITTGIIPFIHVADAQVLAFNQGATRRGAYAAYIDVSHPEIFEFLNMRKPTGGDFHRKNMNIHHGVCITDEFMKAVVDDADWNLIDPKSKRITEKVKAREVWRRIIELRLETGEPYIFFSDTVNKHLPKELKNLGLEVKATNLCTEILLPTTKDRTAVCCLSSVNAAHFDEWNSDPNFIEDLMEMLDNVLEDFINGAPREMSKAVHSASRERSVGLGLMGFHTYLQKKMIAFDSPMAVGVNRKIFRHLKECADTASKRIAMERGEAPDMIGSGHRFAHKIAVAPNATSSLVCNLVSPSIEPINSNSFVQKTKTINFTWRNQELMKHIGTPEENPEIWKSIHVNKGSVQHLDVDQRIKDVFKTAFEIDQSWVVQHAADRQEYIDQGQSVNLFFSIDDNISYINKVHLDAWRKGLKTLYYVRTESVRRTEDITKKVERQIREDYTEYSSDSNCVSCEG